MADEFSFAVLGDTHYCMMTGRSPEVPAAGPMPDRFRYVGFTRRVLPRLAHEIAGLHPEILFSTGDLIEGMGGDPAGEDAAARRLFGGAAPRFETVRGSHDYQMPGRREYGKIEYRGCIFLKLDYTAWDAAQRAWLERELAAAEGAARIFVFGHAPLFLWGRHFFDNPVYRRDVSALLARYPVDGYFCGHTHNQTASWHGGMVQIAGSSLGFPASPEIPLTECHVLPPARGAVYFWGIPEDCSPAFHLVTVTREGFTVSRRTFGGESGYLKVAGRHTLPVEVRLPRYERHGTALAAEDFRQVRCGWVQLFAADKAGEAGSLLTLNGVELGEIPHGLCYEARSCRMLTERAIRTLGGVNTLEIVFPARGPFALGSVSLTLVLLDGRTVSSRVAENCFYCGDHPDYEFAAPDSERVDEGARRRVRLEFCREEDAGC